MSDKMCPGALRPLVTLPWGNQLKLDVVDVTPPPGGSFIELPGPQHRPTRPYLEPFAGPGGIAARVIRGDGQVLPLAVLAGASPRIVSLSESPLALSARGDGGLWVLTRAALVQRDAAGAQVRALPLPGMTLVGAGGDAVWVVNLNTASYVTADGRSQGPYPWQAGLGSAGAGTELCALDKGATDRVRCLAPDGKERLVSLGVAAGPFEQLIGFADGTALTMTASSLRRYSAGKVSAEWTVQTAGLSQAGEAFVSGRAADGIDLCLAQGALQRLPFPPDVPAQGAFRVVAVEGTRALAYGLDRAAWYESARVVDSFSVDDARYQADVFPHLWTLGGPRFAVARPDGTVILSASGPTGVALIELRWNP